MDSYRIAKSTWIWKLSILYVKVTKLFTEEVEEVKSVLKSTTIFVARPSMMFEDLTKYKLF